jgi:aconitate hydratase
MAQKVLAGRARDPALAGEHLLVKVDQVVLARAPSVALSEAVGAGLKKTPVETAVAYDTRAITQPPGLASLASGGHGGAPSFDMGEMLGHGLLVARPGIGYPSAVHLERFAGPARLCVTDEPRLAGVGGAGMMSIVVSPGQLGQALAQGTVWLRPPRSVQVLLTGRPRPFVCARDVALELVRRGLGDIVRRVEAQHRGPVVLEFAGPSARLLSVGERAVLAGLAPQLGAASALFTSDERTEVFLRDQRRSKAHRALLPDAGAPCDEVMTLDMGAVDPLLLDEKGQVRTVRDLAGTPVSQVLLGGDSGVTLRELFSAASLLKSKRVPLRLDFLFAVPSRQMLEALASAGALADLLATGARLLEPDARVMEGTLYPPPRAIGEAGASLRTCDPEPSVASGTGPTGAQAFLPAPFVLASTETLSYAVATGEIGDPRSFKRPVRVTVPRELPTDDVLVGRYRRAADATAKKDRVPVTIPPATPWRAAQTLELIDAPSYLASETNATNGKARAPGGVAVLCVTLDEVRTTAARAVAGHAGPPARLVVRAVLAPFIPSGIVALLSGVGVAALEVDAAAAKTLDVGKAGAGKSIDLPAPAHWGEGETTMVAVGSAKVPVTWLALGAERLWASAGTASPPRETRETSKTASRVRA